MPNVLYNSDRHGYKVIHRGGHHEVYCDGKVHFRFFGDHVGTAPITKDSGSAVEIEGPLLCDCAERNIT